MHILVIFWNLEHKRWYQNQKSDIWHPSASLCVDQMTYKDIKLKFPNVLCIRIGKKTTENILKFSRKQSVKIENICYFEISYTGFPLSKVKRKGISKKICYTQPHFYTIMMYVTLEFCSNSFSFNAVCLSIDLFTFFPEGNQPSNMSDENEEKYL